MVPSWFFNPTVACAAITLCKEIIFPIAPPTTCNVSNVIILIPRVFASSAWNVPNNKFDTVLLPVMKLPNNPIKGLRRTKNFPKRLDADSANKRGMLWMFKGLFPETINNCTNARTNIKAIVGYFILLNVFFKVSLVSFLFVLYMNKHIIPTTINVNEGVKNGKKL